LGDGDGAGELKRALRAAPCTKRLPGWRRRSAASLPRS